MLHIVFLLLLIFVSLSSTSILKNSIVRRQIDSTYCDAIVDFECKCSSDRLICTTDHNLPSSINVFQNEKYKYQAVELTITAVCDVDVTDQTFEPIKELFKPNSDNIEFRIKFRKFTALNLSSSGIFNRVFPDNSLADTQKHLALEIYDLDVPPNDNPSLFKNLNADLLEVYVLYPLHGSFQQLFDGADIKFIRLSGGDIRSDISKSFTGNIARLEIAKQARVLSVENFPVYPVHELIINAFYVTDFNHEHPPNYTNLYELRVYSLEYIPANAFRNFSNIRTLSISSDQGIDPQALNGLNKLENLTIKDTNVSLDLLTSVPSVKEFVVNIEKIDEKTQCQLVEKLAQGQVAVRAIPDGRECTCITAYLDAATGRTPCDAENCEHSSCAVIKRNYNAKTDTFKTPPMIRRADGSNALREREPRVYTTPFQIPYEDQVKLQKGVSQQVQQSQEEDKPDDDEENSQWVKNNYPLDEENQRNETGIFNDGELDHQYSRDDMETTTTTIIIDSWEDDSLVDTTSSPSYDESQEQDEDNDQDEIESTTEEYQPDLICFNLSGYKNLSAILFGIGQEEDSILYDNGSAGYFCGFRASIKQNKANKEKSDLSYDKLVKFMTLILPSTRSTDIKFNEIRMNIIRKGNANFQVLIKNKI